MLDCRPWERGAKTDGCVNWSWGVEGERPRVVSWLEAVSMDGGSEHRRGASYHSVLKVQKARSCLAWPGPGGSSVLLSFRGGFHRQRV